MEKIIIRNVGPISNVEIELKKVNILMGPQSCGKSTIAKIISYCQWVEKRMMLEGNYKYKVSEQLLDFHRLGENYFSKKSFFEYESEFIKITYKGAKLQETIKLKPNALDYKKTKNIYIPSERNFVSAIPNLGKYKETNDNIMSFIYDWYEAKRKFTQQNTLPLLNLGVSFYNNEERDRDVLVLNENKKEIQLREGSSGLQSITPLILIIDYLTNSFYTEKKAESIEERDRLEQMIWGALEERKRKNTQKSIANNETELSANDIKGVLDLIKLRSSYHHSNFIIEEPEQNLFPQTQRDFIYYIFNKIQSERNHSLILTTHSPYILYAVNNCMLGSLVADKLSDADKNEFLSKDSWISPNVVNIFQIEDGTIKSIKDKETGTVNKHYFNNIMNEIMNEYYELLNYFEYESQN